MRALLFAISVGHAWIILAAVESSDTQPVATLARFLLARSAPIRQPRVHLAQNGARKISTPPLVRAELRLWGPAPTLSRAAPPMQREDGATDRIRELERENAELREARIRELEQQNAEMREREETAARKIAAEERAAAERAAAMKRAAEEQAKAEKEAAERAVVEQEKLKKLFLSIIIDFIGIATYAVPVVGEAGDLGWAPISAFLVYQLYGNGILTGLAFAEELLPGLDIIPTATIAWVLENTEFGQNLAGKAPADGPAPAPRSASKESEMKRAQGWIVPDDQKDDRR